MTAESPPQRPPPEQREQRDGSDRATNETDAKDDSARFRKVSTIQEAVRLSLTDGITDKTLFKFARAIRAFEMTTDMRLKQSEISNAFAEWWRTALAKQLLPEDASSDEYAFLFEDAFARAKVPLGANALATAIKRAETAPTPEAARQFTDSKVQMLIAVCFQLQKLAGSSPFFLSVRDCAKIYGTQRLETASAILNGFVSRHILHIAKKGLPGGKQATRFWYGEPQGEVPAPVASDGAPKPAEAATAPARKREMWQLLQDEKTFKDRLQTERDSTKPDEDIIAALRGALKQVRAEIRSLKPAKPKPTETA